jgi:hypothetical protein
MILVTTAVLIILAAIPNPVKATSGVPNSPLFGYGARLDMWGQDVPGAMDLAVALGLDWLAIDVDWNRHWPSLDSTPDFTPLDVVLQAARVRQLPVLLSMTHAPGWALTPSGPDASITSAVLLSILNAYPDVVLAVELFPGANSVINWGAAPNPQAYLTMLQVVRQALDTSGRTVYLVTTLEPLPPGDSDIGLDDQVFLESLYTSGGLPYMPIIGIRFQAIYGAPMSDVNALNPIVLRHYEQIRQMMLRYSHNSGLIWITGFNWPTTGSADPTNPLNLPATPSLQAQWMNEAYQLLRGQLYIGAGFFSNLNSSTPSQSYPALLLPGGSLHPACVPLSQLADGSITTLTWTPSGTPTSALSPGSIQASATTPALKFSSGQVKPRK